MQALAAFKRARECNPANAEAEAKLQSAQSSGRGDAVPKPIAGRSGSCPCSFEKVQRHQQLHAPVLCFALSSPAINAAETHGLTNKSHGLRAGCKNGTSNGTGAGCSEGAVASGRRLQQAHVTAKVTSAEEYAEARAAMVRFKLPRRSPSMLLLHACDGASAGMSSTEHLLLTKMSWRGTHAQPEAHAG